MGLKYFQVAQSENFTKDPHMAASTVLQSSVSHTDTESCALSVSSESSMDHTDSQDPHEHAHLTTGDTSVAHTLQLSPSLHQQEEMEQKLQHASLPSSSSPSSSPHIQLKRLSSNSTSLPALSLCNHKEVTQRLVYIAPSQYWGQDNSAIIRAAILGITEHVHFGKYFKHA